MTEKGKMKLDERKIKEVIDFHHSIGLPYKISISNYTCMLESSMFNVHFLKKPKGRKMFLAYNKIKSELSELPKEVDMNFIKYYQTNFKHDNIYADKIYQVDIRSCYASIMKNKNLISEETYNFICNLSKPDRLSCVGMLASRKNIFEYDGSKIIFSEIINEHSDYFFYCVQETYDIMDECKILLRDDFLFSWVDAIYFRGGERVANSVMTFLKDKFNLDSSFSILKEFEVELRGDYYRLRYIKDDLRTFMNIPQPSQNEKKQLTNFLLNLKYKKE